VVGNAAGGKPPEQLWWFALRERLLPNNQPRFSEVHVEFDLRALSNRFAGQQINYGASVPGIDLQRAILRSVQQNVGAVGVDAAIGVGE
jgi:hypothetical protein